MHNRSIGIRHFATLLFAFTLLAGFRMALAQNAVVSGEGLPRFDVASIRKVEMPRIVPGAGGVIAVGLRMEPSGIVKCAYCTVGSMIEMAWGAKPYQVTGPDWIRQDNFMIEARMPPGTPDATALQMLRGLLMDRFHLQVAIKDRAEQVLALSVVAKGAKLKRTDEAAISIRGGTYSIVSSAMPMADLAQRLSRRLDRPVIDKTGLEGRFEVNLTWQPDGPDGTATDSLFRALRDSMGLELKSDRAQIKEYVVVGASRTPTEN